MHKDFQKHLRPDGLGIDYSKLENYNTRQAVLTKARLEGKLNDVEKKLKAIVEMKESGNIEAVLSEAKRWGLDRNTSDLYKRVEDMKPSPSESQVQNLMKEIKEKLMKKAKAKQASS